MCEGYVKGGRMEEKTKLKEVVTLGGVMDGRGRMEEEDRSA